jgi:hypothetical protein
VADQCQHLATSARWAMQTTCAVDGGIDTDVEQIMSQYDGCRGCSRMTLVTMASMLAMTLTELDRLAANHLPEDAAILVADHREWMDWRVRMRHQLATLAADEAPSP